MKKVRYVFEALLAKLFFGIFSILPLEKASNLGGFIARKLGPLSGASKTAKRQMQEVMPEAYNEDVISQMWDNLGRTVAELPHFKKMTKDDFHNCVEIEGIENLNKLKAMNNGGIFITAHFGNWEMLPKTLHLSGTDLTVLYRAANNKYVDKMILDYRSFPGGNLVPIGNRGLASFIKAVRTKGYAGLLVDQKFNGGSDIKFLGKPAPTGTFVAEVAKKYNVPVIYFHCERLDGHKMKLHIDEPIVFEKNTSVLQIMEHIHKNIESWIRKNPEQWFWVHRRWKKNS